MKDPQALVLEIIHGGGYRVQGLGKAEHGASMGVGGWVHGGPQIPPPHVAFSLYGTLVPAFYAFMQHSIRKIPTLHFYETHVS